MRTLHDVRGHNQSLPLQVLPDVGRWEYLGPVQLQGETVSLWQLEER